jgi:hypothetical protein
MEQSKRQAQGGKTAIDAHDSFVAWIREQARFLPPEALKLPA